MRPRTTMVDDRTALMGQRNKRNLAFRQQEEQKAHDLENENDELVGNLNLKLDQLKHVTVELGRETREQNQMLEGLNSSMSDASSLLSSTVKKLGDMVSKTSNRHLWYLALFILFVFLVIYFSIRSSI
uniref:t-SNARE coiled-coil homology domain-containing protein n=1 Tax=Spongospora subterranea TaxID=70186 RepID=A0A0H5R7C0_9EUKA|eukprot:CRZ10050.1 hypothetical protein [Spongospora subterranea]